MAGLKDRIPGEPYWLQNKFQKKSYNSHQYHDPTYSSFILLIDWYGSPLFNGLAEQFLRETLGDTERAEQLVRFKKNLQKLVMEMPWTFQELEGLEKAFQFGELKKNYRGGDDAVINIKCLESTDLIVTGLMDMYRNIAFDIDRWCEVLPHNMTYFNCHIIMTDARRFHQQKLDTSKNQTNDFKDEERVYVKTNLGIAATSRAHFMITLRKCNFKSDSGIEIFEGLSNAEPKLLEGASIKIGYHIIEYYSKQYLNAFEGTIEENLISETKVGPQAGQENPQQQASYGDTVSGKADSQTVNVDGDPVKLNNSGASIDKIPGFGEQNPRDPLSIEKMDNFGDSPLDKLEERAAEIIDAVDGYPGRLGSSVGATGRGLLSRLAQDAFARVLLGNVYGINILSNIQDAIAAGNINGIINLINQTTEGSGGGEGIIGNINDALPGPEIALGKDNMFPEQTDEVTLNPENILPTSNQETPLEPNKAYDPMPPEEDSDLGNIYDE